jgi:hypothetical protein
MLPGPGMSSTSEHKYDFAEDGTCRTTVVDFSALLKVVTEKNIDIVFD